MVPFPDGSFYAKAPDTIRPNKTYTYKAYYVNSSGIGADSDPITREVPLHAPIWVRATREGSDVKLSWAPVDGARRYRIAISETATLSMPTSGMTTATTYTITSPLPGDYYAVVAEINLDPGGLLHQSEQSMIVDSYGKPYVPSKTPYQSACPEFPGGDCKAPIQTGQGPQKDDPVNLSDGSESYRPEPDLATPNRNGIPAVFSREFHSSLATFNQSSPGLPTGWAHTYDITLWPSTKDAWGKLALRYPNGSTLEFTPGTINYTKTTFSVPDDAPIYVEGQPHASIVGRWNWIEVKLRDESRWRFAYHADSDLYVLQTIYNRVSHGIRIDYNADRTLWRIRDASSLELLQSFGYSNGRLASVLDQTDGVSGRTNYRRIYYRYQDASLIANDNVSGVVLQAVTIPVTHSTSASAAPDKARYGYIGRGMLPMLSSISIPNPTGSGWATATIAYDASLSGNFYRVSRLTDANGFFTDFTFGSNETTVQRKAGTTVIQSYTQKFDSEGRTTGIKDVDNNETFIEYGTSVYNKWLPVEITDAKGAVVATFIYDTQGNTISETDALGITTTYTWAYATNYPLGRLTKVEVEGKGETTFTYWSSGLVHEVTSPRPGGGADVTTVYEWDTLGNITEITSPSPVGVGDSTVVFDYTTDGAYSQIARYGQPIRVIDPLGKVSRMRYDAEGRVIWSMSPRGAEVEFGYDLVGAQTWVLAPATGQQGIGRGMATYTYQYMGGPLAGVQLSDESGALVQTVLYTYGPEGELLAINGADEDFSITYDAGYRQKTLTDAMGRVTTNYYNSRGFPSSVAYPGGDTVQYTAYDENGNLTSATDPNGIVRQFVYTGDADLLTGITYPGLSGKNVTLGYDGYGRLTSRSDKSGSFTWTYGILDEELTETTTYTGLPAKTLTTTYRQDGSRATSHLTGLGTSTFNYNDRGDLVSLTDPFGQNHSWTYEDDGALATQTLGNGNHTQYVYNLLGQITQLTNRQTSGGTLLSQFSAGNRTGLGSLLQLTASVTGAPAYSGTTTWNYDAKGQLTQESSTKQGGFTHPYALDGLGNLTHIRSGTQNRTYNVKNQISNAGFGYNPNGDATTFASNTATWDEQDRLTSYGASFTADYRADGMRAWKGSGVNRRYYLYDGDVLLAELDSTGATIAAANVWGANGLLARRESSVTTYYQFDLLGGTVNRLSSSGAAIGWHTQNAYGIPTSSPATTDPYQGRGAQAGYYRDSETGLYWTGHRMYDAINCRFLSRDPIGYEGGINVYRYAGGNPVGRLDPRGLDWDWGRYGQDVAAVLKGYGIAILSAAAQVNPFMQADAYGTTIGHYLGYGWAGAEMSAIDAMNGVCSWSSDLAGNGGPTAFGKSLGDILISVAASKSVSISIKKPASNILPTYESLLPEAQLRYPKLAGIIQRHHDDPKYMGGDPKGKLTAIDAAYHQLITNEFRALYPYGSGKIPLAKRQAIMGKVYAKYPLPK